MVTERLVAQVVIEGGINPAMQRSLDAGAASIRGMDADTAALTARQRRLEGATGETNERLERMRRELAGLPAGGRAARRLARDIRRVEREAADSERQLREVNAEIARLGREGPGNFQRLTGAAQRTARGIRGIGIAAAAVTAAITAGVAQSVGQFERLNQVRLDFPELTAAQGRELLNAADLIGVDEGRLADIFNELNIQIGDFQSGLNERLRELQTNFGIELDPLLGIEDNTARALAFVEAIGQLPTQAERIAAAEVAFGGSAAQAAVFISQQAGAVDLLNEALTGTPAVSEAALSELNNLRQNFTELRQSTANLRDAFTIGLAPAINPVVDGLTRAVDATTSWIQRNEGVAPVAAIAAGGITGIWTAAELAAGPLASAGESAFFISQGLGAVGRFGPAAAAALGLVRGAALGVAGGIRTATTASLAFIATPVGAAIAGIAVAAGLLVAGIVFLADKVGGFGNLASIVFTGAKAAVLSLADVWLSQFTLIAKAVDVVIQGLNYLPGVDIGFRAGDTLQGLRDAVGADRARAEFAAARDAGLAEGRRQAAEGGGFGRSLGFNRGGDSGEAAAISPAAAAAAPVPQTSNNTITTGDINIVLPNVRDAAGLSSVEAQDAISDAIILALDRR